MDIADHAARIEEQARQAAIAQALKQENTTGRQHCQDCDEPIPEARRQANPQATRCIACQTEHEKTR